MKRLLLAAVLVGFAGAAMAQTGTSTTTTTTTTKFEPAWRSEIQEYVVKEKRTAVPPPSGYTVSVGTPRCRPPSSCIPSRPVRPMRSTAIR